VIDNESGKWKECVVSAQDSTLLTTPDKYPDGDNGLGLRLLSDFLDPTKVSPIEVRRYQITEEQFREIQAKLEAHVLEVLQGFEDSMAECVSSCDLSYLE